MLRVGPRPWLQITVRLIPGADDVSIVNRNVEYLSEVKKIPGVNSPDYEIFYCTPGGNWRTAM